MPAKRQSAAPEPVTTPNGSGPAVIVRMRDLVEQKMTGREIRDFERVQGVKQMNLIRVLRSGEIPYDTLLGLVWILWRREHPEVTFEDMLDLRDEDWAIIPTTADVADDTADPTPEPVVTTTGS